MDIKCRIVEFIVRGIEGDIAERHGFDLSLAKMDDDVHQEMRKDLARIIGAAFDHARPTPRDIDEIVRAKNLRPDETHAVEQTVNALWGTP
jgi:hypothetical protein